MYIHPSHLTHMAAHTTSQPQYKNYLGLLQLFRLLEPDSVPLTRLDHATHKNIKTHHVTQSDHLNAAPRNHSYYQSNLRQPELLDLVITLPDHDTDTHVKYPRPP